MLGDLSSDSSSEEENVPMATDNADAGGEEEKNEERQEGPMEMDKDAVLAGRILGCLLGLFIGFMLDLTFMQQKFMGKTFGAFFGFLLGGVCSGRPTQAQPCKRYVKVEPTAGPVPAVAVVPGTQTNKVDVEKANLQDDVFVRPPLPFSSATFAAKRIAESSAVDEKIVDSPIIEVNCVQSTTPKSPRNESV